MKVQARKHRGSHEFQLVFVPDSEQDQNFLKVLASMAIEGGSLRVSNKILERATFQWNGITGAILKRNEDPS